MEYSAEADSIATVLLSMLVGALISAGIAIMLNLVGKAGEKYDPVEGDPWREAIERWFLCWHRLPKWDQDPMPQINELLAVEQDVALTPAVSKGARELIARAHNEEIEALRKALLDHNAILASAFYAAQRDATHDTKGTTNYRLLANRCHQVLSEHKEIVQRARDNLT